MHMCSSSKHSITLCCVFHSHVWIIVVQLSSRDSDVLSENLSVQYPDRASFRNCRTAGPDQPYVVAEIAFSNYVQTPKFALGDNSSTMSISDFPDRDCNDALEPGTLYSYAVRFFTSVPSEVCW